MTKNYDIFISYRRKWGALYARILQLKLQEKGYKVFLDYDELRDGHFDEKIFDAIKNSSLFFFIYSKDSLVRCANDNDWVRKEIESAISLGKHIIPVIPDREVSDCFDSIPQPILEAISRNEHSDIDYGKALDASVDELIKDRVIPHVGKRSPILNKIFKVLALALTAVTLFFFGFQYFKQKSDLDKCLDYRTLKSFVSTHDRFPSFFGNKARYELSRYDSLMTIQYPGLHTNIVSTITYNQLVACHSILSNMISVKGGAFYLGADPSDNDADDLFERPQLPKPVKDFMIGKYEVSVGEWCSILELPYNQDDEFYPMTGINWLECQAFVDTLNNLTGVDFFIPTEAEWEYAARGGQKPDNTKFAGNDDVGKAAVYEKNSQGHPAMRNYARTIDYLDLESNGLGLYDMSGNVEEWCSDDFRLYSDIRDAKLNTDEFNDENSKVIRGGSYISSAKDVRITTRGPKDMRQKSHSVGLRLASK